MKRSIEGWAWLICGIYLALAVLGVQVVAFLFVGWFGLLAIPLTTVALLTMMSTMVKEYKNPVFTNN